MRSGTRSGLAALVIMASSLCMGVVVWLGASHVGLALICGLLALLGLVSAYSLLAYRLGWPPPKWSDVWAIGYLLP